jgi:hypothetical protein
MIPDGKGDDDISSMEEPSLFRVVSPDVGEGGGVNMLVNKNNIKILNISELHIIS